jgi:hypothetical protein
MWIFGQVWFACLVGFGAGVLLDGYLRVRPLRRRVDELEEQLAAGGDRQQPLSSYDRARPDDSAPDSLEVDRDRLVDHERQLAQPSVRDRDLSLDELLREEPDLAPTRTVEPEPMPTGYAGYRDDPYADRLDPAPYQEAPYQEAPYQERPDTRAEMWTPQAPELVEDPTEIAPMAPIGHEEYLSQAEDEDYAPELLSQPGGGPQVNFDGGTEAADQQYLEYLRAGSPPQPNPVDPSEVTMVGADSAFTGDQHTDQGADERVEYEDGSDYADERTPVAGDETNDREATTVMPAIVDVPDDPRELTAEGGELMGQEVNGFPEQLPHREERTRYSDHIPFVDSASADPGEGQAQSGQLTPIGNGGFQPFQKPLDPDEFARHDVWVGEDGQLIGRLADGPDAATPANGLAEQQPPPRSRLADPSAAARAASSRPAEDENWFAELGSEFPGQPGSAGGQNGHRQHNDQSVGLADAANDRPRSLFEPVIDAGPDNQHTQQVPPPPVRVRTGVEGQPPAAPQAPPAAAPGWQAGPFGPGSALPLPDGSAPSPQFRIKARTSSMVFHTESSPFYERLEPQVWFRTPDDAQRAGFTSWERPRTY